MEDGLGYNVKRKQIYKIMNAVWVQININTEKMGTVVISSNEDYGWV